AEVTPVRVSPAVASAIAAAVANHDRLICLLGFTSALPGRVVLSGSAACVAVEGEGGGLGVVARPGALEAELDVAAGRDGGVVGQVRRGRRRSRLADRGVPAAGDLLVAWEAPYERPAVDRGGAGVGHRQVRGEPAAPLVVQVRHLTRTAAG